MKHLNDKLCGIFCDTNLIASKFSTTKNRSLLAIEPSVSLGLCLPAVCKVNQLESVVNDAIHTNLEHMEAKIPEEMCQLEGSANDWKTLDFVTM